VRVFAHHVAHPTQRLDLISGLSFPRSWWKRRDLPGFRVPPYACAMLLWPRRDLGLSRWRDFDVVGADR